jgi:glyceraldehyde-3-phosphate dehydrogenase/erythrose-4-phosphate dehydrogenase
VPLPLHNQCEIASLPVICFGWLVVEVVSVVNMRATAHFSNVRGTIPLFSARTTIPLFRMRVSIAEIETQAGRGMSKLAWSTFAASIVFTTTVIHLVYKDQDDQRAVSSNERRHDCVETASGVGKRRGPEGKETTKYP